MTLPAAILVVDDNDDNRYTLVNCLQREGYTDIAVAADGREALAKLAERPFDLVLLDVMMPELDGIETLGVMKADPALRHIPVVMISAVTDLEWVVRCIELGADDYLPKPFNRVLLRARVGACVERKRLHDQEAAHLATIERERQRADELLHAILPAPAVAELKATNCVIPRRFEDVTVLMSDVVAFTPFCEAHPPELVVANLHALTVAFEELAQRHGLEKIQLVGDALLATADLLELHPDAVPAAVRCALELIEAGRSLPVPWEVRCGIHVGPVVAGVVGRSKLRFDIWGDTVNLAARLSSLGERAAVHLSEAAWKRLDGRLPAEALGPVTLKGRGEVPVFRVETDAA